MFVLLWFKWLAALNQDIHSDMMEGERGSLPRARFHTRKIKDLFEKVFALAGIEQISEWETKQVMMGGGDIVIFQYVNRWNVH